MLLGLLLVPDAWAGSVEVQRIGLGSAAAIVVFSAASGEANDVRAEALSLSSMRVEDSGAEVIAGAGCTAQQDGAVICTAPWATNLGLVADLGDGNDRVEIAPSTPDGPAIGANLRGGSGDDVLIGGGEGDFLVGGPGADQLFGRGGTDQLVDGDSSGSVSADLFDGGDNPTFNRPGLQVGDVVSYVLSEEPVRVDLSRGVGGQRGEGDRLVGIESATGGTAADVLIGDSGPNQLQEGSIRAPDARGDQARLYGRGGSDGLLGSDGRDRLVAGPGQDYLLGDKGRDALFGGRGDDRLTSWDSSADTVDGGPGKDLASSERKDTLRRVEGQCRTVVGACAIRSPPVHAGSGRRTWSW